MKKLMSVVIILLLAASLFAGCEKAPAPGGDAPSGSGSSGSKDGVQVGIILPTRDEPRWLQDQAQFEKILGEAGFTNQVLFSQGSPATERTNVETLVTQGAKVIIICAHDGAAAAAAVEGAKKEGVTIIAYDRLITDTDAVDYYVTFNSVAVGEAQGQYLVDHAPSGSGIPLYLYAGAATDNNAFLFFEGAWNVLQPKIADGTYVIANSSEAEALKDKASLSRDEMAKIIGQVTTDWDFNVAKSKAEANLTGNSADLKGEVLVLAPNDGTARSIADTFTADNDVTSYVITGQDAEKASVQYVIDGQQSMTVFKDTRTLAADSVAMAIDILNGKVPTTGTTYDNGKISVPAKETPVVSVDQSNVKAALIDSGYYSASDFTGIQ